MDIAFLEYDTLCFRDDLCMQIINLRVSKQKIYLILLEREKDRRKPSPIDKIAGKAVFALTIESK